MAEDARHAAADAIKSLIRTAASQAGRAVSLVRNAAGGSLAAIERELIRRVGMGPDGARRAAAAVLVLSFASTAAMGYRVLRLRGAGDDDGSGKGSLKGRPLIEVDLLPEFFVAGLLAELPQELLSRLLLVPRRGDPVWPPLPRAPPAHPSGTVLCNLAVPERSSSSSRDRDRDRGHARTASFALRSPVPLTNVVHRCVAGQPAVIALAAIRVGSAGSFSHFPVLSHCALRPPLLECAVTITAGLRSDQLLPRPPPLQQRRRRCPPSCRAEAAAPAAASPLNCESCLHR